MSDDLPRFLRALRRLPTDRPPVWFMRQAGRSLPEYRELRAKHSFLEVAHTPELACEVTLQPIRRFGYDASILFSDILILPEAMGMELTFGKGMGPKLAPPLRDKAAVDKLGVVDPHDKVPFVPAAVKLIVDELPKDVPLIGFAGAPFTVACYMVEGQGSKNWAAMKTLMHQERPVFDTLMDKLVDSTIAYLRAQVEAGCRAVQLFDTWAGELDPADLTSFAIEPARRVLDGLRDLDVPLIYFAKGCAQSLDLVKGAGADAYGLDWRVRLDQGWDALGADVAVQGNLDPTILLAGPDIARAKARAVLQAANGRPGHVFNLGHGVLPETPIESVQAVLDEVRTFRPEAG